MQLGGIGGGGIMTTATYVHAALDRQPDVSLIESVHRIITSDMYTLRVCVSGVICFTVFD